MRTFTSHRGKLLRSVLSLILALVVLFPLNQTVSAGDPEVAAHMAPVNSAFLKYIRQIENQENYLQGLQLQGIDTGELETNNFGYIPPISQHISLDSDAGLEGLGSAESLPSYYNWKDLDKVTSVKNQGNSGTCWAFGIEGMLESRILIADNMENDLSELNLASGLDPSWVLYHANRSETGGNSYKATDTLAKIGARDESVQPYGNPAQAYETVNEAVCDVTTPPLYKATDFRIVTNNGTTSSGIAKIKNAIYAYGPVSAAFYADNIIKTQFTYDFPTDFENDNYDPNHMVLLVGWDDSIDHPSDGGKGAWIAKNSWGTSWGYDGYFYLCYEGANLCEVGSFHGSNGYKAYDSTEQMYYWDEAGNVISLNLAENDTCWMRSVYTAQNSKALIAVAFWTTADNASYEIYILDKNNTQIASQSGTCNEEGYYTIPLTSPIGLTKGQQFKIDVKMTTPGYNYPIAAEFIYYSGTTAVIKPAIQKSVTYIKSNKNDSWVDMANIYFTDVNEDHPGLNCCLRAITDSSGPTVTTSQATSISANVATLNASLEDMGLSSTVYACFRYGTSTKYGSLTPEVNLSGTGDFSYSIPVSSPLTPNTTYHFQAVALGDYEGAEPAYGADLTFKTSSIPVISTGKATDIGYITATLNGSLTKFGAASEIEVYFDYGTTTGYGSRTAPFTWTAEGPVSAPAANLLAGTVYHFRMVALGDYPGAVPVTGKDAKFTTKAYTKPKISTTKAIDITKSGATLTGKVSSPGASNKLTVYFEYGPTQTYGARTPDSTWNTTDPETFSASIEGLDPGTKCYFRAVAVGDYPGAAPVPASGKNFTTAKLLAPALASPSAKVESGKVTLKAKLNKLGSSTPPVNVHFEYWTAADPNHLCTDVQPLIATGYFYEELTLTPGTTYYFCAVAYGEDGTATSATKSFKAK